MGLLGADVGQRRKKNFHEPDLQQNMGVRDGFC